MKHKRLAIAQHIRDMRKNPGCDFIAPPFKAGQEYFRNKLVKYKRFRFTPHVFKNAAPCDWAPEYYAWIPTRQSPSR